MGKDPIEQKLNSFTGKFSDAVPDEQFASQLEEKLLLLNGDQSAGQPGKNNFLFISAMRKALKVAIPVAVLAMLVGGYLIYANQFWIKSRYELWTLDQASVLGKLQGYASTGGESIATRLSSYAANGITAEADSASDLLAPRMMDQKSYTEAIDKYTAGPARDKCLAVSPWGYYTNEAITSESYSYYDTTDSNYAYYNKNVTTDSNGNVIGYYLTDQTGSYTYYGGDFAIFIKGSPTAFMAVEDIAADSDTVDAAEDTAASPPTSEPDVDDPGSAGGETTVVDPGVGVPEPTPDPIDDSVDEPVAQIDGEIVDIVMIDGREAYVVKTSYETGCDLESVGSVRVGAVEQSPENAETIVLLTWYDKSDYSYIQSESYFGTESDDNLMYTHSSSYSSEELPYEQVASTFKFDLDVDVVTVEYPDDDYSPEAEKEELYSRLQSEEYTLVTPIEDGFTLNYVNVTTEEDLNDPLSEYMADRDFYAPGELGEKMYQEYTSYANLDTLFPEVEYGVTAGSTSYSASIYHDGTSLEELIRQNRGDSPVNNVSLTINGETVGAVQVEYGQYSEVSKSGGSAASSGSGSSDRDIMPVEPVEEYYSVYYIFEYQDNVYTLSVGGSDQPAVESKSFKTYSSNW
ncbi:MAG: hypothetical protein QY318_04305 [Candidatus Dojkabacteria bacterium]|nr:MAG: hypothetical protein QY318_04305 [Candidatus Dojkabacteria bacterium]